MALQKSKILSNGISGNYWKITSISVQPLSMSISVLLDLCVSETFKSNPLRVPKVFIFTLTHTEMGGDLRALAYTKILAEVNTVVTPATNTTPAVHRDEDLAGAASV